jgi:hypothetical protein
LEGYFALLRMNLSDREAIAPPKSINHNLPLTRANLLS